MVEFVELVKLLQRSLSPTAFLVFVKLSSGDNHNYELRLGNAAWLGSSSYSSQVAKRSAARQALEELKGLGDSKSIQEKLGLFPGPLGCGCDLIIALLSDAFKRLREERNKDNVVDIDLFADTDTCKCIQIVLDKVCDDVSCEMRK